MVGSELGRRGGLKIFFLENLTLGDASLHFFPLKSTPFLTKLTIFLDPNGGVSYPLTLSLDPPVGLIAAQELRLAITAYQFF